MNAQELQQRLSLHQSFLVANDGQFLGKLTLNRYDSESIFNKYGNYGNPYSSTSIFNKYSSYGSPYSSLSPSNPYTSTPPAIYLKGIFYGYLTKNNYIGGVRLDPDNITNWLEINGLRYQ